MALFKTVNVTLALSKLVIEKADDRWGGVEPYVVPVFYKVDGDRYQAILRILNSLQPRPGSTEVVEDGSVQFAVNTLDDEGEVIEEDNPLIYVPPGNLLGRGEFNSGDTVDVSDVSFTTNLIPIPLVIDVLGLPRSRIIDALQGLTVAIQGEVQAALNTVFFSLNTFIGDLFGLDERFESCPDDDVGSSDFISQIEAQFKCLIPGTIGGVFVCMENDAFGEGLARDLRSSLKEEIESVLNNTVNAIALNNPIPDPEFHTNVDRIADSIKSDLTWPVVADIGVSLGAIINSALSGNVAGVYGIVSGLSWLAGGPDDIISQVMVSKTHLDLGAPATSTPFDADDVGILVEGDDNRWRLRGATTVNSVA